MGFLFIFILFCFVLAEIFDLLMLQASCGSVFGFCDQFCQIKELNIYSFPPKLGHKHFAYGRVKFHPVHVKGLLHACTWSKQSFPPF